MKLNWTTRTGYCKSLKNFLFFGYCIVFYEKWVFHVSEKMDKHNAPIWGKRKPSESCDMFGNSKIWQFGVCYLSLKSYSLTTLMTRFWMESAIYAFFSLFSTNVASSSWKHYFPTGEGACTLNMSRKTAVR